MTGCRSLHGKVRRSFGGARGPGTGDPEREGNASGDGKCTFPSPVRGPGE